MTSQQSMLAGVIVTPRGDAWRTGAPVGLGAPGAPDKAVDKRRENQSSPARGELAYLAVTRDEVAVFQAHRGVLRAKVTDEVLGQAPRSELRASRFRKAGVVSALELEFADGSIWSFDVGPTFARDANQVAGVLQSQTG